MPDCIFRRVYTDSAGEILLHYMYKEQMRKKVSRKQVTTLSSAERVDAQRPGKFIFHKKIDN